MSHDPSPMDRFVGRWPGTQRERALVAATVFGTVGFTVALVLAGGWALLTATGAGGDPATLLGLGVGLPLSAGVGAVATGAPLWWLLVEAFDEPTRLRGALVGTGVGILAHPLLWFCFGLGWLAVEPGSVARADTIPGVVADLLAGFVMITFTSAVVGGVVTVPVAVGVGIVLARSRARAPVGGPGTDRERRHHL